MLRCVPIGLIVLGAFSFPAASAQRGFNEAERLLIEKSLLEVPEVDRPAYRKNIERMPASDRQRVLTTMRQHLAWISHQPPPEAYVRVEDQTTARQNPSAPTCVKRQTADMTEFLPTTQCYRFSSLQRMRGVWINEFEGSKFYPGRTTLPVRLNNYTPWWEGGPVTYWLEPNSSIASEPIGQVMMIEFEGRQTLYPGRYGHLGMSSHYVVMDKLIVARPLKR